MIPTVLKRGRLLARVAVALLAIGALPATAHAGTTTTTRVYTAPATMQTAAGTVANEAVVTETTRTTTSATLTKRCTVRWVKVVHGKKIVRAKKFRGAKKVVRCRMVRSLSATETETEIVVAPVFPLAASCGGEFVALTGHVKFLEHTTIHDDGSTTEVLESNYQGVSGIGGTSQLRYTNNHITRSTSHFGPFDPPDTTVSDNVHLIRQGEIATLTGTDDLRTHFNVQFKNGVLTHINVNGGCQ